MAKLKSKEKAKIRAEKSSRKPLFDISQETRNSIWGIFGISMAVVTTLSFIGRAGQVGDWFNTLARSMFGWGFFVVPIAFLLLGIAFIKSLSRQIATSAVLGTILFILSVLAMFFIFGQADFDGRIIQGGYLGVVLGYPLLSGLGFSASMVILMAALFVSFLVTLNVPIYRLVSQDGEIAKNEKKVTDSLVIKRGNEIIDAKALRLPLKPEAVPAIAKPAPVQAQTAEKDFVLRSYRKGKWSLPPMELLNKDSEEAVTGDINASAQIIKRTLANFGIEVEMGEVSIGPTVTQFTLRPAVGVKLARISALQPDMSLALAAHPIRIEAPIPGKSLVGIEVPNKRVAIIGLRNMFESEDFKKSKAMFPLALGRDVSGAPIFSALEKMPHLLIAGATGSGKSVAVNAILLSMLYRHSPEVLKMILVDPKRVELTLYNNIPHLITPVITDNKKVLGALKWAVAEMDRRYDMLSKQGTKDIFSYNEVMAVNKEPIMPYIVVVIDEMADLMASFGRDVEAVIVRLAQMSRAVGIHLILSTQRPSVEVITGLIKANITSRVALQVASQIDSRTIIDMSGAEKLLGKGDMLFLSGDTAKPRRLQGAWVTEKEVKDVVKFIKDQADELDLGEDAELIVDFGSSGKGGFSGLNTSGQGGDDDGGDEMYFQAKDIVIQTQKASASFLQRRLGLGYARAAKLLDILEANGVVGPVNGAKPRDVYIKADGTKLDPMLVVAPPSAPSEVVYADTPEADREES